MKVLIEINCENEAFGDYPSREFTRIVENLLYDIGEFRISLKEEYSKPVYDRNGNKVGELKIEE